MLFNEGGLTETWNVMESLFKNYPNFKEEGL